MVLILRFCKLRTGPRNLIFKWAFSWGFSSVTLGSVLSWARWGGGVEGGAVNDLFRGCWHIIIKAVWHRKWMYVCDMWEHIYICERRHGKVLFHGQSLGFVSWKSYETLLPDWVYSPLLKCHLERRKVARVKLVLEHLPSVLKVLCPTPALD